MIGLIVFFGSLAPLWVDLPEKPTIWHRFAAATQIAMAVMASAFAQKAGWL